MIPLSLIKHIESALTEISGKADRIHSCERIGGGSINTACRIEWADDYYFLKWNSASKFPKMFANEADGLRQLNETKSIKIPEVLKVEENQTEAFLMMEFIHQSSINRSFWEAFGRQLAELHRNTTNYFGNIHDNYIGSLPQSNAKHDKWPDFFVLERLSPLVKLARDNQRISGAQALQFDKLYTKIESLFPPEKPALLHGDLWSGNFLSDEKGLPVLIDPAVYYGHREMDIAMTKMFGGFETGFYESYNRYFELEKGWEKRIDLCNLYPLLVHLNLFGSSYLYDIERTLRYFVQ